MARYKRSFCSSHRVHTNSQQSVCRRSTGSCERSQIQLALRDEFKGRFERSKCGGSTRYSSRWSYTKRGEIESKGIRKSDQSTGNQAVQRKSGTGTADGSARDRRAKTRSGEAAIRGAREAPGNTREIPGNAKKVNIRCARNSR